MAKSLLVLNMMFRYFILSAVIVFSSDLKATSCWPKKERIFAECSDGSCANFLYVREVQSYDYCSRRPVIEKPPEWSKEVFEFEIQRNNFRSESGVYELLLDSSLMHIISDTEKYRLYSEESKKNGSPLATLSRSSSHSIDELRIEWMLKETKEYQKMLFFKMLDWLILLIASVLLIYSIVWFHKWQKSLLSIKWMYLSISLQVFIFIITFVSIHDWSMPLIAISSVFIPGIWLYQIVSVVNSWWFNRRLIK